MLSAQFDRRRVRTWIGILIGVPVTLVALPFGCVGFLTGASALSGATDRTLFIVMMTSSFLGLLGIVGAWLRITNTQASLAAVPAVRRCVLGLLTAGVFAALLLAAYFGINETPVIALVMIPAAAFGVFLIGVSLPARPNNTVETDAREIARAVHRER